MTPEQALSELATFLQGFKPSPIPTYPNHKDARALISDLEAFAKKADAVIEALGDVAADNFGGGARINRQEFKDVITNALELVLVDIDVAGTRLDEDARAFNADRAGWWAARQRSVD